MGVMVLNSDLNLPLLNAHFQLLPFYGLRQPHTRDALHLPGWAKPRPELARALEVRIADILVDRFASALRRVLTVFSSLVPGVGAVTAAGGPAD